MYDTTLNPEWAHPEHPIEPGSSHDHSVARPVSTPTDSTTCSGGPSIQDTPVIESTTRLALERDVFARWALEIQAERDELEAEVSQLERTIERNETKRQQLIERYERIIETHRREYRDLLERTQETRSCSGHLLAAVDALFDDRR